MADKLVRAAGNRYPGDYYCSGSNDQATLETAIAAAGSGSTVFLSSGVFNLTGDLDLPSGVSLIGRKGTVLDWGTNDGWLISYGNQTIANFQHKGYSGIMYIGSNTKTANVESRVRYSKPGAFYIYAGSSATLSGFRFDHCFANQTSGIGFEINGDGTGSVSGVVYSKCRAFECGIWNDYPGDSGYSKQWITGWDVSEGTDASNVTVIDCVAERCWESGFHGEFANEYSNILWMRCLSVNNGQKNSPEPPTYGAGFTFPASHTLVDCVAIGNVVGFMGIGDEEVHTGEVARLIKCSSIASTSKGYFFDSLPDNGVHMDKCSVINTSVPLIHFWDTSYALVNGLCRIGCTGSVTEGGTSGNNSVMYDDAGGV